MTESQILTLTEADREHRRTFMEYCVTAAEERYQRLLRVLYEHFEAWNQDFFGGQLFPPHFLILAPKSPSAEGDYMPYSGWGSKSQLRLRPSLFDATHPHLVNGSRDPEGFQRYWLDVALHEVVHQYCNEILGKPERAEKGHGNTFAKECTRIGKQLGLPPVGPARKSRNREGLPSCAFWPSNVRPVDYYLGAYRPDLAPKRGKATPAGAPGAPDTGGEGDEEGIDTSIQPERSKVLQPAEWHRLLAAVRDLAIAELVERLATHHGVPVIYPITPPALVEPPGAVAETLAIVSTPPLPAQLPQGEDAGDDEIMRRLSPGFEPSTYQLNLFRFILFGQGDGLVNAVAGSGKTTSLVQAARLLTAQALFVAFNKHIAEELSARLQGTPMRAKTIHSIGYACLLKHLGKMRIDDRKYNKLCREVVQARIVPMPGEDQRKAVGALQQLVNFARLTLTSPTDRAALEEMIDHYGIELDPKIAPTLFAELPRVLTEGERIAERQKIIDFTDQIYLPHRWQLQPPRLAFVFVDECQDLNAAQLDLVLKCRAEGGRMVFVGDPQQSIMGFSGADNRAFWNIQARTGATLLPLSICYRCPSSHVDLARQIVPQIEARPAAPAGIIDHLQEDELADHIQEGDMVICRLTAPLIKACIRLIERRIPARVRGRNIGEALSDIVRAVEAMPGYQWEQFGFWLDSYASAQRAKIAQREGSESQLESLNDRIEAVRTCYLSFQVSGVNDLCDEIEALFSDDESTVLLSTIHRAKGLEKPRIFLLFPDKVPLEWPNQKDWEFEQELHLKYVALTRAKEALFFVHEKPKQKKRRGAFEDAA